MLTYTASSPVAGPSHAHLQAAQGFIARHAPKTIGDPAKTANFVEFYWRRAIDAGLDPALVLAQTWHETALWSSWWFAPPRRNPAGIGVNGATTTVRARTVVGAWQQDSAGVWRKGRAYGSYAHAALAHIDGLCLWVHGRRVQRIVDLLRGRPGYAPPRKAWGSVTTLEQLGWAHNPAGIGWAHPGTNYGARIASLANSLA